MRAGDAARKARVYARDERGRFATIGATAQRFAERGKSTHQDSGSTAKPRTGGEAELQAMAGQFENQSHPIPHSAGAGGVWQRYHRARGFAEKDVQWLRDSFNALGSNHEQQAAAKSEIMSELAHGTTRGQLVRDHVELEDRLWDAYEGAVDKAVQRAVRRAKTDYEDGWTTGEFDSVGDAMEGARDQFLRSRAIHRRGKLGDDIESWTSNKEGAAMSPSKRLEPDHSFTMKEMRERGYRILGGVAAMMGSPGEAEITMIRLPAAKRQ